MSPKLTRYALHLALGVGKHRLFISGLFHFVGRPWLRQTLLEVGEIVGAHGSPLSAQHHKSHWSIELRYLCLGESAGDLFGKTKAGHTAALAIALFHIVVDLNIMTPNRHVRGQPVQSFCGLARDESFLLH